MKQESCHIAHAPEGEARCGRYTVTLDGQPADVLAARVSRVPYNVPWPGCQRPLDQTEIAGFVRCEADGAVEVCVTVADPFKTACVRPLRHHIDTHIEGRTVRFTLPGPGQYTLEPDDFHRALHLFVSPAAKLPAAGPDTLVYGPGVHKIGVVELHDNQTVVLEAGAVVYGGFAAFGARNVTITGTGVLDGSLEKRTNDTMLIPVADYDLQTRSSKQDFVHHPEQLRDYIAQRHMLNGCIRFYNCRNVVVSHLTCRDSSNFTIVPAACDNVLIDDVKTIGMWRYNSDGIDLFNTANCTIRNSFLRNFDDCVVVKGIPGWECRNNENLLVENCVVWCDWGRALEIGAETNAPEYRNLIFHNCDVIHGSWLQLDIQHHNDADIHDVLFDDIRCEYTRAQLPMKFQNVWEESYEQAKPMFAQPGLLGAFFFDMGLFGAPHAQERIHRITFRSIQVLSDEEVPMPSCEFTGLNSTNRVEDILLENITRNGRPLKTPEELALHKNEFTENIIIR